MSYTYISSYLPEQHRAFHTSNVPFFPVTILDESGRPWGSVFAGKGGETGFVKSPDEGSMTMDLASWEGDPLLENLRNQKDEKGKMLVAGIGIELSTRRRNKFAGWIESSPIENGVTDVHLELHVNQSLGFACVSRLHLDRNNTGFIGTVRNTSTSGSSPQPQKRTPKLPTKTCN